MAGHTECIGRREATTMLLVETNRGKQAVASCCDHAEARGVRPGMSLAHARSLLRGVRIVVAPFTRVEDEAKLRSLARWTLRFTPLVAPDPPDSLLADIGGCEHLYGGERQLVEKLAASLRKLGFASRIVAAPTFGCARAVARFGGRSVDFVSSQDVVKALEKLPITALRLSPASCESLIEMGVEHIGQLLELPRDQLISRFGDGLLTAIDQAVGRAPETIEPVKEESPVEVSRLFDAPVTAIETILAVVHQALIDLVADLRKQQRGVHVLLVKIRRIRLEAVRVLLRLTRPSNNVAHLWLLLQPRIEGVNLGYGVEEIFLRATKVGKVADEQATLWSGDFSDDPSVQSTSFGELLDRLIGRLGKRAVTRLEPTQAYVPERAFQRVDPGQRHAEKAQSVYPVSRPSRLLNVPEMLRVIAIVPDRPPVRIQWRNESYEIVASVGPERIAAPWWGSTPTETRDYFMVQDKTGRWLWVFHDHESGHWFLHGEWA